MAVVRFVSFLLGLAFLLIAAMIPISVQWMISEGPVWMSKYGRGEHASTGLFFSASMIFLMVVAGGVRAILYTFSSDEASS